MVISLIYQSNLNFCIPVGKKKKKKPIFTKIKKFKKRKKKKKIQKRKLIPYI